MGTLRNSEDPDEMLQKQSISQGSTLFAEVKTILRDRNSDLWPLKIYNEKSHPYRIQMYGKIHQNTKG